MAEQFYITAEDVEAAQHPTADKLMRGADAFLGPLKDAAQACHQDRLHKALAEAESIIQNGLTDHELRQLFEQLQLAQAGIHSVRFLRKYHRFFWKVLGKVILERAAKDGEAWAATCERCRQEIEISVAGPYRCPKCHAEVNRDLCRLIRRSPSTEHSAVGPVQ